jgi:putative membrane protein
MARQQKRRVRLVSQLRYFLSGIAMGIANVIPGVSGGTILVILRVYEKLIDALCTFHIKGKGFFFSKSAWQFLILLGAGIIVGVFGSASVMEYLLTHHELYTYSFLLGLLGSSLLFMLKTTDYKKKTDIAWVAAGAAVFILILIFSKETPKIVETQSADKLKLVIGGFFAAVFMLLPGISGSMMLVIFGLYTDVLNAVSHLELLNIALLGVGIIFGILSTAKIMRFFLDRYKNPSYFFIIGLMAVSLFFLWKIKPSDSPVETVIAFLFIALGFFIGYWFSRIRKPEQKYKTLPHEE